MTARRRSRRRAVKRAVPRARSRTGGDPIARERALDALSRMRSDGISLTHAARDAGTTPRTVLKYVGRTLNRDTRGRYRPTPSDRLTRRVWMLTASGKVEISVRSSRTASRIAQHMAAVELYLRTGSTAPLAAFRGEAVRAGGQTYRFLVKPDELDRLQLAGETSFERLYVMRG